MHISVPYGRTRLCAQIPGHRVSAVLRSRLEEYVPALGERELEIAEGLLGRAGSVTVIPEGISTIIA